MARLNHNRNSDSGSDEFENTSPVVAQGLAQVSAAVSHQLTKQAELANKLSLIEYQLSGAIEQLNEMRKLLKEGERPITERVLLLEHAITETRREVHQIRVASDQLGKDSAAERWKFWATVWGTLLALAVAIASAALQWTKK